MPISNDELPEDVEWRDTKLYSIAGWFAQQELNLPYVAFGGYFRFDVESGTVGGLLTDCFGNSVMEGAMDDSLLVFGKRYVNRIDVINYTFRREGDLWVGEYVGDGVGSDESECRTFLTIDDAFRIACGEIQYIHPWEKKPAQSWDDILGLEEPQETSTYNPGNSNDPDDDIPF